MTTPQDDILIPSDRVAMAAKAKQEPCLWTEDALDGGWIGSCGIRWECDYETPKDNGMNFCPRCGRRLEQKGGQDGE